MYLIVKLASGVITAAPQTCFPTFNLIRKFLVNCSSKDDYDLFKEIPIVIRETEQRCDILGFKGKREISSSYYGLWTNQSIYLKLNPIRASYLF